MATQVGARPGVPLAAVKPEAYSALSREAIGALKFASRKANVKDDWTKGGRLSGAWDRMTGFPYWHKPTYDVDYLMRVVSKVAQELPAWREVTGQAADALVMRMPQYAAWFDWVEEKEYDPNRSHYPLFYYEHLMPPGFAGVYNAPGYCGNGLKSNVFHLPQSLVVQSHTMKEDWPYYSPHSPARGRTYNPDPIYGNGGSNMMYKGYFAHQLMLARLITGDDKYEQPMRLVYDENIQYTYDARGIIEMMCDQHLADVDEGGSPLVYGIDCEVGKVFPVCVSVGGLAAHLHDKLHGTKFRRGYDQWLVWAKDNVTGGHTEPEGAFAWCAPYFDRDIPYCMSEPRQQMGAFFVAPAIQIAPVDPKYALRIYEGVMKTYGRQEANGLHVIWPPEVTTPVILDDPTSNAGALALAHEFDDRERAAALKAWIDANYPPTYKDGEFYFTFGLDEEWPRGIPNSFATLAYIGEAGSFRRMYNDINLEKFTQPTVSGIDYPRVAVRQASYDAEKDALILSITPGVGGRAGTNTTFKVSHLGLGIEHEVLQDGQVVDDWANGPAGEILVRTTVGDHTFVIR
ncbi:MAG TPA: hypothetical protein VMO88_17860 [Acidimicrobiales bacterium]|nr:hypothetical protein [Acidimicrobiales bacterium]